MSEILSKNDVIDKFNAYAETCDDDVIRFKEKIKDALLKCPEILYALNWNELEDQLFNPDGSLNEDGEWDRYYGTAIRPYMIFPDTVTDARNYLCFTVHFEEVPKYNKKEYYYQVSFVVLCYSTNVLDRDSGLPRHDLVGAILRERFNWSNIFGTQCHLISNNERTTDNNFLTRTLIFQGTLPNSIVQTMNGNTQTINHLYRR